MAMGAIEDLHNEVILTDYLSRFKLILEVLTSGSYTH